jgi:hypothetical protein
MEAPLSGLSVVVSVSGTRICTYALLVYLFIHNIDDFCLNLRHTFIRISRTLEFYEAFAYQDAKDGYQTSTDAICRRI